MIVCNQRAAFLNVSGEHTLAQTSTPAMKILRRPSKRLIRRLSTATSFAALLLASPLTVCAAARSYIGSNNSLWTNPSNWSPLGEPLQGDDVVLGTQSAGTTDLHVVYNRVYNYVPQDFTFRLNSVTLNSSALNGSMIVDQNIAGSTLLAEDLTIGSTVNANTWNLSEGNFYALNLVMGRDATSKNNTLNVSNNGNVSIVQGAIGKAGAGVINQTGGKVQMNGDLVLGSMAGSSGTYNLSGGLLQANNNNPEMNVGAIGTGLFSVSGGTADLLTLNVNSSGGAATCNVTGGLLQATGGIYVGDTGSGGTPASGTFNVSGAGKVFGLLTVRRGGTFNLKTGGEFQSDSSVSYDILLEGGLFSLQGGTIKLPKNGVQMSGGSSEFRLNGYSVTLGGLSGNGGIVRSNAAGNVTLALNVRSGNDYGFSGTVTNGTSGVVSLAVTGPGSQTLSGSNSYTGTTTVTDGGTLKADSNSAIPVHTSFILSNGGTFDANGFSINSDTIYGNGGILKVDGAGTFTTGSNGSPASFTGQFVGNGTINKVGAGQLSLNAGASTFNGTFNLQNGAVVSGAANSLPPLATFNVTGSAVLATADDQTIGALAGSTGALLSLQNNPTFTVGNNNTDSTYLGQITPDGTVQKIGTGTFTLGSGANDTAAVSTGTGGPAFAVAGGTLALNKALGTNTVSGPLTLTGGTVTLARGQQIADSSPLTVNGGTFKLNGNGEIVGHLAGAGGTIDLGGGTLTVTEGGTASIFVSTALTGGGTFVKNGTPSLTLYNTANSGGTFVANNGFLYLQGASNIIGASANNGGVLNFLNGTANLNGGTITANPGGFVQYFGATINNAYLRGSAPQVIVASGYPASTFNNVTTYNSAVLTQNGGATFNNFTNGGTLINNSPATYSGGLNTITGAINVKSTLTTTDFGTSGVMTISSGGTLSNTGSNLVAGGGSRTTINSGGTLSTASGTSIELNGALLVNNGTQTGQLDVNYGSTAKGSGTFGMVSITDGGRFGVNASTAGVSSNSIANIHLADQQGLATTAFVGPRLAVTPATANMTSLALGSGSVFAFVVQDTQGTAGAGYDLVHVTGALTLAAGVTVGDRITVSLASLGMDGSSGLANNFDPTKNYLFVLVQADGGITGFNPGEFMVDSSNFKNTATGAFTVVQQGNNLVLAYNAVPEPGTWAFLILGAGGVLVSMVRRRA